MKVEVQIFSDGKITSLGFIETIGDKIRASSDEAQAIAEQPVVLNEPFEGKDAGYIWTVNDGEFFLKAMARKLSGAPVWVEFVGQKDFVAMGVGFPDVFEVFDEEGKRFWLVRDKNGFWNELSCLDNTPFVENNTLLEIVVRAKESGWPYIIWGKPGFKSFLVEIN